MAKRTKETVRNDIFGSFFSDERTAAALRQQDDDDTRRIQQERESDWSGVTSTMDSSAQTGGTTPPASGGALSFDNLLSSLAPAQEYVGDMGSSAFNDIKSGMGARIFTHDDMGNKGGAEVARGIYDQFNFEGGGAIGALLNQLKGKREDTSDLGKRLYTEGSQAKADIAKKYEDSGMVAQGGMDLAGSPLGALSVFGGPTAGLMGEDVFNKTYAEARQSGVDKEGAAARAAGHAALETGIAAIPAGKFLSKIPGVNRVIPREALVDLFGNATKFVYKTGLTAAGESAEETVTTLAQMGLDRLLASQTENAELAAHAKDNLPKSTADFFEAVRRSAVAGAMGGGALGGPVEALNIMKAAGQEAAMLTSNIDAANNEFNPAKAGDVPRSNAIAPTQMDMFGTPEGLPSAEQYEADRQKQFEIDEGLRQGRAAEGNAAALAENRESERLRLQGVVDTNRQKVEFLQEQVNGGKTDQQTLSSLAAAVRDTKRAENDLAKGITYKESAATPTPAKKLSETEAGIIYPTPGAQADLFSNQESAQLEDQRATAKAARVEATKVVAKEGKGVQEKAKSARAAARRTFLTEQREATANLEPEARIDAIADATVEWDAANPVENFVSAPAAVKPAAKKATKKKLTSKPAPVAAAVQTTEDEIKGFLGGLSTQDETGKTDTKVADVTKALVSTLGQGNTRVLAKLINDKNLKVVGDASQIPKGAAPAGAAGFYDGKRMYVVANKLDPKNIVGDMLEIAAHETKHAADISGKVTLGGMVGAKANRALNAKIIAAMNKGDAKAKAAYDNAKAGSNSKEEFELELPAYYINEARDSSGSSRAAIMRDALDAVRASAKRILPGEYKVQLSDVAHLSKVLLREAAIQGKQMEGNIDGGLVNLPMIMGPGSKDFAKAKAEGRTYKGAQDGIERFTTSDSEAVLDRQKAHDVAEGKEVRITDIYKNDVLFSNYPKLKDVKITVDPSLRKNNAYYDENVGTIFLAKNIPAAVLGQVGHSYMEEVITHELQHGIQGLEGMSRGGSSDSFLDEADVRIAAKSGVLNRAVTQVEQRLRSTLHNLNLNEETMEEIRNHLSQSEDSSPDRTEALEHIANAISADHGANAAARKIGGDIRVTIAHARTARTQNEEAELKRHSYYKRLYGEIEARNAASNRKRTQAELPLNPETAELEDGGFDRDAETAIPNFDVAKSFQIVKHGTPHTFQSEEGHRLGRFRDDKMGTGEGAQAFGWGHYLTEMWSTADSQYRRRLLSQGGNGPRPEVGMVDATVDAMISTYYDGPMEGEVPVSALKDVFTQENIDDYLAKNKENVAARESTREQYAEEEIRDMRTVYDRMIAVGETERAAKVWARLQKDWGAEDWEAEFRKLDKKNHLEYVAKLNAQAEFIENTTPEQFIKLTQQIQEEMKGSKPDDGGEVYYVDVPEDQFLMNWDAPVKDQPLLKDVGADLGLNTTGMTEKAIQDEMQLFYEGFFFVGLQDLEEIKALLPTSVAVEGYLAKMEGAIDSFEDIYLSLGPSRKGPLSKEKAVEILRSYIGASFSLQNRLEKIEERENSDKLSVVIAKGDDLVDRILSQDMNGEELYDNIQATLGSPKAASKYLHSKGILGHYFQPPSRERKTRNFVIYDESSLTIVGRDAREKGQDRKKVKEQIKETVEQRREREERASASKRAEFEREARERVQRGEGSQGLAFTPRQRAAVEKNDSASIRATKRLLFPEGGFDSVLSEAISHSRGLAADLALHGDFLGNELLRAFHKATNRNPMYRKKGEVWVREQVSERMDEIDKLETRDQRNSALTALDREFPGVGTAIRDIRDAKMKLAQEIVALRLREKDADGNVKPLTDKERAVFNKMIQNAERYTTRAYLATYNKEIGRSYGKNLLARAEQDPESEEGKTLAAALDYLVDVELVIPDPADLAELKMGKLRRLHENWIGPATNFKKAKGKAAMIQALTDYKNNNVMDLDAKAMEVVKDMLQQTTVKSRLLSSITSGAKQNRTILEGRTDIPPVLRKLLGEITDPFLRESISLYRMNNLVAKTKLLVEVAEKGRERGWYSDKRTDKFDEQLNGAVYGAMDGKWISHDTSDALTGTIVHFTNLDDALADSLKNPTALMEWAGGKMLPVSNTIMGIQKTWQVVANAANMGLNLVGSPIMAVGQGIINPKTYAKGMHGAAMALMLEVTSKYAGKEMVDTAGEVVRAGAVDSATMGEFKTEAYQTIVKQITKLDPTDKSFMMKAIKVVWKESIGKGVTANSLRQVYAFMDVWVKTATYYDRKAFLTEFNRVEGTGKSQEDINRQAGYEAAGTNISYERAIPLVKLIERNVPIAMFATYFSEVPRAMAMSYVQVVRDTAMANNATTPEGRRLATTKAATRLAGTLIANLGVVAATMAMLDGEDEEEKRRKKLDANYQENRVMVSLGKDADGNERMFTINRADPSGPLNEFLIDLLMAPEGERSKEALESVKDLFVKSKGWIKAYQVVHDVAVSQADPEFSMKRNKNTMLEKHSPAVYQFLTEAGPDLGTDFAENAVSAFEALFVPSGITGGLGIDESRNLLGYKAYVRDPDKSLSFRVMDYTNELKRLKGKQKDFIERQHTMSAGSIASKMKELLEEEKEAYDALRESYDGYLAYEDRTPAKAAAIFDNKKAFQQARSPQFRSSLLDQKSLQNWYKEKLKDKTIDRAELRKDYALLRKVYLEVGQDGKEN